MKDMTKRYVIETLVLAPLWKTGESDTFRTKLHENEWIFTLRREEDKYEPYKYSLNGHKTGTNETWSRRYTSIENAFLHIVNNLNENANIKNRYASIDDWLGKLA